MCCQIWKSKNFLISFHLLIRKEWTNRFQCRDVVVEWANQMIITLKMVFKILLNMLCLQQKLVSVYTDVRLSNLGCLILLCPSWVQISPKSVYTNYFHYNFKSPHLVWCGSLIFIQIWLFKSKKSLWWAIVLVWCCILQNKWL